MSRELIEQINRLDRELRNTQSELRAIRSQRLPRTFGGSAAAGLHWWVWFHVDVAIPSNRSAICSIRGLPIGRTLAEVPKLGELPATNTTLIICDPVGCFFNEPGDDLVGRQGFAKYGIPQQATLCQPGGGSGSGSGSGAQDPEWMVYSLCCPEPSCG